MTRRLRLLSGAALLLGALVGCASSDTDESTDATEQPWSAESATEEGRSTHLFLVNHAVELLASRKDLPRAAAIVTVMNEPRCRERWQQGLLDADYLAPYNGGRTDLRPGATTQQIAEAGATWASHFYDPDTERNYDRTERTGRTETRRHLEASRTAFAAGQRADACYELGLALHYFTDITQPMHSSNFTALSSPSMLHSNIETYATTRQDQHVVRDASDLDTHWTDADALYVATARRSKALWPTTVDAVRAAYRGGSATCQFSGRLWTLDVAGCWQGDASVDRQIGAALEGAQRDTAAFLFTASAIL